MTPNNPVLILREHILCTLVTNVVYLWSIYINSMQKNPLSVLTGANKNCFQGVFEALSVEE